MFCVTINNILVIILLIIMLSYPLFYFHYINIIIKFSPYNLLGERLDKLCFFFHPGFCQSDIIIIIIYIYIYITLQDLYQIQFHLHSCASYQQPLLVHSYKKAALVHITPPPPQLEPAWPEIELVYGYCHTAIDDHMGIG